MPDALDQDAFARLLNLEKDTFRLTVRGHAAIEGELDALIAEAFAFGMPDFLRRMGVGRKVEVASGLGYLIPEFVDPMARLTKLRNEFAHGDLDELTLGRARNLFGSIEPLFPAL